ncbi:MAG: hypothetical protein JSS82_00230 [Bacteroidetes bacterium]|nr:hypothetical protein [Bacteroidota bacterium]
MEPVLVEAERLQEILFSEREMLRLLDTMNHMWFATESILASVANMSDFTRQETLTKQIENSDPENLTPVATMNNILMTVITYLIQNGHLMVCCTVESEEGYHVRFVKLVMSDSTTIAIYNDDNNGLDIEADVKKLHIDRTVEVVDILKFNDGEGVYAPEETPTLVFLGIPDPTEVLTKRNKMLQHNRVMLQTYMGAASASEEDSINHMEFRVKFSLNLILSLLWSATLYFDLPLTSRTFLDMDQHAALNAVFIRYDSRRSVNHMAYYDSVLNQNVSSSSTMNPLETRFRKDMAFQRDVFRFNSVALFAGLVLYHYCYPFLYEEESVEEQIIRGIPGPQNDEESTEEESSEDEYDQTTMNEEMDTASEMLTAVAAMDVDHESVVPQMNVELTHFHRMLMAVYTKMVTATLCSNGAGTWLFDYINNKNAREFHMLSLMVEKEQNALQYIPDDPTVKHLSTVITNKADPARLFFGLLVQKGARRTERGRASLSMMNYSDLVKNANRNVDQTSLPLWDGLLQRDENWTYSIEVSSEITGIEMGTLKRICDYKYATLEALN